MRLAAIDTNQIVHSDVSKFSKWVLDLGDSHHPVTDCPGDPEPFWIGIPDEFLIIKKGDKIAAIINVVYTDLQDKFREPTYLQSHAILSPTNEIVDEINSFVLARIPGDEIEYLSCDAISKSTKTRTYVDLLYPIELVNSIDANNFPQHKLVLKVGVAVMLLRNLNKSCRCFRTDLT